MKSPACPNREATPIKNILVLVRRASNPAFGVETGTDIAAAVNWTPPNKRKGKTVCD